MSGHNIISVIILGFKHTLQTIGHFCTWLFLVD